MVTEDRRDRGSDKGRPRGVGGRRAIATLMSVGLAWSLALGIVTPMAAAPGNHVNVDPETATVSAGDAVSVTATVLDDAGEPVTSSHVRWYFVGGSPSDHNADSNGPDFSCHTDASGSCTISYTPTFPGTDRLCALAGGSPAACDEAVGAAEWTDNADVVQRVVVSGAGASSTQDATPTPAPTSTPTPMATSTPAVTPTATPTPAATEAASEPIPTEPGPTPTDGAPTPASADAVPTEAAPTSTPAVEVVPSPDDQLSASSVASPSQEPAAPVLEPRPSEAPTTVEPSQPGSAPDEDIDDPDAAPASPESRPGPRDEPHAVGAGKGARSATHGTAPNAPVTPARAVPELPSEQAVTAGPGAVAGQAFGKVVSTAADQVGHYVRLDAAVAVATEFTFPLALAIAVVVFLLVQHHVDRREPKLRSAPQNATETLIRFQGEDQL